MIRYVCILLFLNISSWALMPFRQSTYRPKFQEEKSIVVIIPSYNNALWYKSNLDSIMKQKYNNYRVIYVVDGRDTDNYDGTAELVEKYKQAHPLGEKITIIKNEERKGSLYNIYNAVMSCDNDDVIALVDGDDALYHDRVLKLLNDVYHEDVWVTHGSLIEYPTGETGWSIDIPHSIIIQNKFRSFRCASHLKTFYVWLFKKIKLEDLMLRGQFFPMTGDQAIMLPMCEMAGTHQCFISSTIYVYNIANQINDNKVNPNLQRNLEAYIRNLTPYSPLDKKPMDTRD